MALASPTVAKWTLGSFSTSDAYRRLDKDGKLLDYVNYLAENNQFKDHIPWVECNDYNGHKISMITDLPKTYWKRDNLGVPATHGDGAVVRETIGKIAARTFVFLDVLKNLDQASARADVLRMENQLKMDQLNNDMVKAFFKASVKNDPASFDGFEARYNSMDPKISPTATQVIDCGGKGDNLTSMWIVGWGLNTAFGLYPQNRPMGIQIEARGEVRVIDPYGNPIYGDETQYEWAFGLGIKDRRSVVRLANIDPKMLESGQGIGAADLKASKSNNILTLLHHGLAKLPNASNMKVCIYANRDVLVGLQTLAIRMNSTIVTADNLKDQYGNTHTGYTLVGHDFSVVDALTNDESEVKGA